MNEQQAIPATDEELSEAIASYVALRDEERESTLVGEERLRLHMRVFAARRRLTDALTSRGIEWVVFA